MTNIIKVLTNTLLFLFATNALYAEPALPVTTQTSDSKIEISDEIKIKVDNSPQATNSKLKQGDACSDENLEEAKGELIVEIPMAKTIPCEKVDCKDLKPAKLFKDNYKKLKVAKTISCGKK